MLERGGGRLEGVENVGGQGPAKELTEGLRKYRKLDSEEKAGAKR
jgi:hypothetical protein